MAKEYIFGKVADINDISQLISLNLRSPCFKVDLKGKSLGILKLNGY